MTWQEVSHASIAINPVLLLQRPISVLYVYLSSAKPQCNECKISEAIVYVHACVVDLRA